MKTAAVFFLLAATASAAIDLTPRESTYEVEGATFRNVSFRNGDKLVSFSPPARWTLTGGAKQLTLTPPAAVQAAGIIESVAVRELPRAEESKFQIFNELALTLVPKEAVKVEILETALSAMRLGGRAAVEVTLSYVFFGQTFRLFVLALPRENELLRFHLVARTNDFPALYKEFRGSFYSLQGL